MMTRMKKKYIWNKIQNELIYASILNKLISNLHLYVVKPNEMKRKNIIILY